MSLEEMIAQAISDGKLTRLPTSGRENQAGTNSESQRVRPETCGSGRHCPPMPHLDQIDGDWS